jgi:hypothetical protein
MTNLNQVMHDEDNAIGLDVVDPQGSTWKMFGDKRLLDPTDDENKARCQKAVQVSADEIFNAWLTQTAPPVDTYQAWLYAPTLASARATTQDLAPLFTFEQTPRRRVDVANRRQWNYTLDYWYLTTYTLCMVSGLWNYPITIGS